MCRAMMGGQNAVGWRCVGGGHSRLLRGISRFISDCAQILNTCIYTRGPEVAQCCARGRVGPERKTYTPVGKQSAPHGRGPSAWQVPALARCRSTASPPEQPVGPLDQPHYKRGRCRCTVRCFFTILTTAKINPPMVHTSDI